MKNKELIKIIQLDSDLYRSNDLANIIIYFKYYEYFKKLPITYNFEENIKIEEPKYEIKLWKHKK